MPHNEMESLRRHWAVEAPADDLADRIVAHALAQPQRLSWRAQWQRMVDAIAIPQQQRGFAFAACMVVAVIAFTPQPQSTKKISSPTMEKYVEQMLWDDYRY